MEWDGLSVEGSLWGQLLEASWSPIRNDRTKELYIQDVVRHLGGTPLKYLLTVKKIQILPKVTMINKYVLLSPPFHRLTI